MLNLSVSEPSAPSADFSVQMRQLVAVRSGSTRVAIVTNIPAPYRLPMYELLAAKQGIELQLFFCSGREADREWDLARLKAAHVFLQERVLSWRDRYIHANPDLWPAIASFRPDVVVTTGFNPTHLLAFIFARLRGLPHVAMTDGTAASESALTFLHRRTRRWVYRRTEAFVGASEGSFDLYRQYDVPPSAMFKSHLCANNPAFAETPLANRDFDFIFCGRFVEGKLPLFAIEVAAQTSRLLGRRVRLLLVGSGKLADRMRHETELHSDGVEAHFTGFARQAELPGHYARAKVLLFPTLGDTWGVVANEACAAGVPVLVSPQAGVAGDLIVDGENGRVLSLDAPLWSQAAAALLTDSTMWGRMSACARRSVESYTYERAAEGLASAIARASGQPREVERHD
jgi:glycosyltransferase involved in cell wall biosynthesis